VSIERAYVQLDLPQRHGVTEKRLHNFADFASQESPKFCNSIFGETAEGWGRTLNDEGGTMNRGRARL